MKNSSRQVSEMEVFGEKILGPKIGIKILDGKWVKWKHGKLVQKLGIHKKNFDEKIGLKNYIVQKMEKIVLVGEKCCR